jgi:hypothetical protein
MTGSKTVGVDVSKAVGKVCSCGCIYFIQAYELKTLSAIISPTGKEVLIQKAVWICKDCGTLLEGA